MQNSLHLVGDGDDLDVLRDVERAFAIEISDDEARVTGTVGALHDLIETKCGDKPTQICLSQFAFNRLRRALSEMGVNDRIAPDTSISLLSRGRSIGPTWRELRRRSGLRLPPLETSFRLPEPSKLAVISTVIVAGAIMLAGLSIWMALLLVLGGVTLSWLAVYFGFRGIPSRIQTVGDLAREAAGYSFAELRDERSCSRADRWQALVAILRAVSGHKRPVTRETTFFSH